MSEEQFSLPIPISQDDQQFLDLICDDNYRFPSVYDFVKAAKILDFWPDKNKINLFKNIFMSQDFGIWDDEEEELELPLRIFFMLHQIVSQAFNLKPPTEIFQIKCLLNPKIVLHSRNFRELLITDKKLAFLLCFCKNTNFNLIYVEIPFDWTPELFFYIAKIVKRNPNMDLKCYDIRKPNFYKNLNDFDSIFGKPKESTQKSQNSDIKSSKDSNLQLNSSSCLAKDLENSLALKLDLESQNRLDTDYENSYEKFLNSIHSSLFEWRMLISLKFMSLFTICQEFEFFSRFFNSIPHLDISLAIHEESFYESSRLIPFLNQESFKFYLSYSRNFEIKAKQYVENFRFSNKLKSLSFIGSPLELPFDIVNLNCSSIESLTIHISGKSEQHTHDFLRALSSFEHLSTLSIGLFCSLEFNNTFLNYISHYLPRLKFLEIVFYEWPGIIDKVERFHFSNLEHFSFAICEQPDPPDFFGLFVESLTTLKSLRYTSKHPLPDDFFSKLPRLESLSILQFEFKSNHQSFLSSPDQHLKSLKIHGLISFDYFSNLRILKIHYGTPNFFREVQKLISLEELSILKYAGQLEPYDFDSISRLKKLKKLHFQCFSCDLWGTVGIPSKGESLETVTWSSQFDIIDDVIMGYFTIDIEIYRIFDSYHKLNHYGNFQE